LLQKGVVAGNLALSLLSTQPIAAELRASWRISSRKAFEARTLAVPRSLRHGTRARG